MSKEQEGVVIEINADMAKVRAGRHNDCKNCGACPGQNSIDVESINPVGAKPGQRVVFEVKETNMLMAAFVVYMLPLIMILAGVGFGSWLAVKIHRSVQPFEILGGVLAFVLSVAYIKFFDKSLGSNSKMKPVITRVLS